MAAVVVAGTIRRKLVVTVRRESYESSGQMDAIFHPNLLVFG
jgi:hypothetical protein